MNTLFLGAHMRRRALAVGLVCGVGLPLVRSLVWAAGDAGHPLVQVGAAAFSVEVADTDEKRHRGLMFRRYLPADQGMLFTQPPGRAEFWMKNTLIPLDLLFFDADGTLVEVLPEVQPCRQSPCPIYPSASAAVVYILEINGGEARRRSIRVGDTLSLDPAP